MAAAYGCLRWIRARRSCPATRRQWSPPHRLQHRAPRTRWPCRRSTIRRNPAGELHGWTNRLVAVVAFAVAVLTIWQVFRPLPQGSQYYLIVFLAGSLPLVYLVYRSGLGPSSRPRRRLDRRPARRPRLGAGRVSRWWSASIRSCRSRSAPAAAATTPSWTGRGCSTRSTWRWGRCCWCSSSRRAGAPPAGRCPVVCVLFLAYGYYGGLLPQGWAIAHAGLDFDQIVDALYNSGSGFFGTPLDVAATYIVLFTIYGAVLELLRRCAILRRPVGGRLPALAQRGRAAPRWRPASCSAPSPARGPRRRSASARSPGRSCGGPGYTPERAGGVLAAAGVGALLSPPTLGAAAFIVAEYLEVSYLHRARLGDDPDGPVLPGHPAGRRDRRPPVRDARQPDLDAESPWKLLGRFGYHFSSLIVIVVLLAVGMSATRAVVYATVLAFAAVLPGPARPADTAPAVRRPQRRGPRRAAGRRGVRRGRGDHRDDDQDRVWARSSRPCWSAASMRSPTTAR